MIILKDVDRQNWFEIVGLRSAEDMKNKIFERDIASNCFSLTQASIEKTWSTKAIYHNEEPVGFAMYGYSEELSGYEVCRFMIDFRHQGKGYGKEALLLVIEEMKDQYHCSEILLTFHPGNARAMKLYESIGFKDTGKVITHFVDELIYALDTNIHA